MDGRAIGRDHDLFPYPDNADLHICPHSARADKGPDSDLCPYRLDNDPCRQLRHKDCDLSRIH